MRLAVLAIGRMKAGPERELLERYQQRVGALAPQLGLAPVEWREFDESRARSADARRAEESKTLLGAVPKGAALVALDERGKSPSSEAFSAEMARARDGGTIAWAFVIGGPDGLDASVRAAAKSLLCFGAMTWPHQLARVMLAEQIYRACSILTRHPYHRE